MLLLVRPVSALAALFAALVTTTAAALPGEVVLERKYTTESDQFRVIAPLGDVDGDAVDDRIAALLPALGGLSAVEIRLLNTDGFVDARSEITSDDLSLGSFHDFGRAVAGLGDLDGDSVPDAVVGAPQVGFEGAVYILFLNSDGTLKSFTGIGDAQLGATFGFGELFGATVANLGDLDGDGVVDIAVGASGNADGGTGRGSVWIIFLNTNGTVKASQKISDTAGSFAGVLDDGDAFGSAVAGPGDVDGDGDEDVLVGAPGDDDGGSDRGALWALFLATNGTVEGFVKLSDTAGGFGGGLDDGDAFGSAVAAPGDVDGDTFPDVVVGAPGDDDAGTDAGALWTVLFQSGFATALGEQKTTGTSLGAATQPGALGTSLSALGDVDGDGAPELGTTVLSTIFGVSSVSLWIELAASGVGSAFDLAGGALSPSSAGLGEGVRSFGDLDHDGFPDVGLSSPDFVFGGGSGAINIAKLGSARGGLKANTFLRGDGVATLSSLENGMAPLPDIDGDGTPELVLGQPDYQPTMSHGGAIAVLFLNPDGSIASEVLSDVFPGITLGDGLGFSIATLGDVDGDGVFDLAVGAPTNSTTSSFHGAVWILLMNADGTVKTSVEHEAIGGVQPSFARIGETLAAIGDLDGDGVPDLAAGTFFNHGAWVLFLNADGTLKGTQQLGSGAGGFAPTEASSVGRVGDLDGDGVPDLAIGAPGDSDGASGAGAAYVVFLNSDGTAKGSQKISALAGGFQGQLGTNHAFGTDLDGIGDVDGDGVPELVVGAKGDNAAWLLFLDGTAAVCGDGVLDPGEECDDGDGGLDGGGCSATCELQDELSLYGFAFGGDVTVTINQVVLVVPTMFGHSAADVLAAIAAAVAADPTLAPLWTTATVSGNQLYTNGALSMVVLNDPGLSETPLPPAPAAPALHPLSVFALAAALAMAGGASSRRSDGPLEGSKTCRRPSSSGVFGRVRRLRR